MEENTTIFKMIMARNVDQVREHLAEGHTADLLTHNAYGAKPLEFALMRLRENHDPEEREALEQIALALVSAASEPEILKKAFITRRNVQIIHLAVESRSAAVVHAIAVLGLTDPFQLETAYDGEEKTNSLVSHVLLSASPEDRLPMLRAVLSGDDTLASKLIEYLDQPDEVMAGDLATGIGPTATASLILPLHAAKRHRAARHLINCFSTDGIEGLQLSVLAKYEFLDLSIYADRTDILRACLNAGMTLPGGPDLLVSAITSGNEEAAILLLDAGAPMDIVVEFDMDSMDASFLPPEASTSPFEAAIDEEMDHLLIHWFNSPTFQKADFLKLLRRSYDGYEWILDNPDIAYMLANQWEPAPRLIQDHFRGWLEEPDDECMNWSIETFWPAFIRSYANNLDMAIYTPLDLRDDIRPGQTPEYWLLDAILFMQTTGNQVQRALGIPAEGDRARLYQFHPAVLQQIHEIGISPSWICTTATAAFRDMDEGERRARALDNPEHQGAQVMRSIVAATCMATFEGLKAFMATLRGLGKWRGVIDCCLDSLTAQGDPVADLIAFATEPTVPEELREEARACAAELAELLESRAQSKGLTLQETILLDYIAKFGLDHCTPETLLTLTHDQMKDFILDDQSLLNLLVIFGQERARMAGTPNPVSCLAMWRLLEVHPEFEAPESMYAGIAELDTSDTSDTFGPSGDSTD
jgi:hypothetical protein